MVLFARGYGPLLFHLALVAKILEEISTAFWYVYEDYESDLEKSPFLVMIVFQSLMAVFEIQVLI